jgi:hypothetical protein
MNRVEQQATGCVFDQNADELYEKIPDDEIARV